MLSPLVQDTLVHRDRAAAAEVIWDDEEGTASILIVSSVSDVRRNLGFDYQGPAFYVCVCRCCIGKGLVRDGRVHEELADGAGIDEELRREVRVPD